VSRGDFGHLLENEYMPGTGDVFVGTSGWHYPHWKGAFYPPNLPASRMLDYYAEHLRTVELNNTFYRLPTESAVDGWRDSTPAGFCFAVKGSRYLTHMKKLKDAEPGIARFFERVARLGRKFGPVIFQLPPSWEVDAPRLDAFLSALPKRRRYAFELRNPTWHTAEILRILRRHNAAFCIFEISGQFSGLHLTANFSYMRLHGPGGAYQGSYPEETLRDWRRRITEWRKELRAVYVYFDNDQAGYAVENAITLQRMLD
jgi:uncharacterized protein YecE (DUF72 family)